MLIKKRMVVLLFLVIIISGCKSGSKEEQLVDCGEDVGCFIGAKRTCSPSKLIYEDNTQYEIKGEKSGSCIVSIKFINVDEDLKDILPEKKEFGCFIPIQEMNKLFETSDDVYYKYCDSELAEVRKNLREEFSKTVEEFEELMEDDSGLIEDLSLIAEKTELSSEILMMNEGEEETIYLAINNMLDVKSTFTISPNCYSGSVEIPFSSASIESNQVEVIQLTVKAKEEIETDLCEILITVDDNEYDTQYITVKVIG